MSDNKLDDNMINFAKALQDYCDSRYCDKCPFNAPTKVTDQCLLGIPQYWELKGVKKNDD